MVQSIPAMEMKTLDLITLYLLQDSNYGLSLFADAEERELVHEAISLIGNYDRNVWTLLKQKSLILVGSTVSDVVSRIASAYRTPDVALSCIRDASEKWLEIKRPVSRDKLVAELREQFKLFHVVHQ